MRITLVVVGCVVTMLGSLPLGGCTEKETNITNATTVVSTTPALPWSAGDVVPGFVLRAPSGGRADLVANGTYGRYAAATWNVMITRRLTTPDANDDVQFGGLSGGTVYSFSAAIFDNAGGETNTMNIQDTTVYTLGNAASSANVLASNPGTAPTDNPSDLNWGTSYTTGGGSAGTMAVPVTLRAAYDATNLYLLATWADRTSTESNLKESWVYDGSAWTRRSAKGGDGAWATTPPGDGQWDEDRLAIWWNISVTGFGASGCQALCHSHRMGTHTLGEKCDLWHWKAARTNPMGFADDQRLVDGTFGGHSMAGRSDDTGTGMETPNVSGTSPAFMAADAPGSTARFLFDMPLGSQRQVPYLANGFGAGAVIPGFTLRGPTAGLSDVRAKGAYNQGVWTVLFTRALTTSWTTPAEDVQFGALATGTTYAFSCAVFDNAGGENGTMSIQNTGPYTLGNEGTTANLRAKSVTAAPAANASDAGWGSAFTYPGGTTGTMSVAVTLRAAYDAANVYLLAVWTDFTTTESDLKQSWVFNGTTWTQRLQAGADGAWITTPAGDNQWDEDRLAIWWNISVTGFSGAGNGCSVLCHHRMGTHTLGEKADLWHWKAARTNAIGFADDQGLRVGTWAPDVTTMEGRSDDTGTGTTVNNTGAPPGSMAENDPNAQAKFLWRVPLLSARAVVFIP